MKNILLTFLFLLLIVPAASAQEIGQIKKITGDVQVERSGSVCRRRRMKVQAADTVRTGKGGSVGITLSDNTMLSAGPGSVLTLSKYRFDSTTHQGELEANMRKGTLSMVSGKLAKQSSTAVRLKTPTTIIGVRGTEFFVSVEGEGDE